MPDLTDLLAELAVPRLNWISGTITAVAGDGSITLQYGGGTILKASRLTSYTPVVGDRVEALSHELMGVMILGKNSASTSSGPVVTPQPATIITPTSRATYGPAEAQWAVDVLEPGEGKTVCFFYSTGFAAMGGVQLQSVEIELNGVSGETPSFIGHQNDSPVGSLVTSGLPYNPNITIPSATTWVPIAIGIGQALIAGAIRGIGIISDDRLGSYAGSGRVRLTPLSVTI